MTRRGSTLRRRFDGSFIYALLVAVVAMLIPTTVQATNGMYLTGYGAEVVGRGGANLAIADRSLAINFNPAGIAQLQGHHLTYSLSILAPIMEHENLVNPVTDAEDNLFPLPAITYVRGSKDSPWSWGIGFVAQGGMGARYKGVNTFFGTRDEIFSEVRFMTFTPTLAYEVNEDMALGATFNIGYGDVAFRFYPETSFFNTQAPEQSFFGIRMEEAGGLQYNLRLGWWWRAHPRFNIGLIYQSETESDFESGDTEINFTNHPFLGQKVRYESDVDGFTFAAQAGIGFAVKATDKLQIAFDIKRYFWDDAIDNILVTASDPEVMGAPPEVVIPFVFNWEDQWVLALGGDYRVSDKLTLRAGYNYGENPVPDETLTPLFPATVEHHVSIGFSWLSGHRTYELALEHAFDKEQTNGNFNPMVNPFGPGSMVSHEQWLLSFSVSSAWARK